MWKHSINFKNKTCKKYSIVFIDQQQFSSHGKLHNIQSLKCRNLFTDFRFFYFRVFFQACFIVVLCVYFVYMHVSDKNHYTRAFPFPFPLTQVTSLQGYDWIGWSNDSIPVRANGGLVEMTFRFDAVRNFSSARLRANNVLSRDVAVFRRALPFVSVDGRSYASLDPVDTQGAGRDASASVRDVVLPLVGAVGRFIRLRLEFAAHWMLISEVEFTSGLYQRINCRIV